LEEMDLLRKKGQAVIPFARHRENNRTSPYSGYFAPAIEWKTSSIPAKMLTGLRMIYSSQSGKKFAELLDFVKPDIIHMHNIYGGLTTAIIDSAKRKGITVVMTLHDYKLVCPSYTMLANGKPCGECIPGKFYNCVLTRCHKGSVMASAVYTAETYFNYVFRKYEYINTFITPSRFSFEMHRKAGISANRLSYLPNFVETGNFEPSYSNSGYILFAGRLSHEKGLLTLLEACKGLEIPLKIAGDGPARPQCEIFARENNLKNVEFAGYKTGKDLKGLYKNACFVVLPSEWYENNPLSVIESFAYGKPVIGSNIGGIPELVVEGETGMLFQPGDHQQLREKMLYLFNNPSMIEKLGRNAREKVEKENNPDAHYEKLMEIYQKALR